MYRVLTNKIYRGEFSIFTLFTEVLHAAAQTLMNVHITPKDSKKTHQSHHGHKGENIMFSSEET